MDRSSHARRASDRARRLDAPAAAREARSALERAVRRLRALEDLAAGLAGALAPREIARLAVERGASALGFSTASVVVADPDGALEVLHRGGADGLPAPAPARLPPDAAEVVAEAWRIESAIWLPTPAALAGSYPALAGAPRRLREAAWAAVPLRADGRTLGAIGLGFARPRALDGDERGFLLAVADLLAQALARARLRDAPPPGIRASRA